MPLIDLCTELAHFCIMGLNYDETFPLDLNVKTINSNNSKAENERNKRADVIVTTIASSGTGTDIPGITDIICCSPFKSSIVCCQVMGRIRYCGKVCNYYDIVDRSVQMDCILAKLRMKTFSKIALKVNRMTWTDDEKDSDEKE